MCISGIFYQNVSPRIITSSLTQKILNFYEQPIDSDIKRHKEIQKLAIGQGEDYTIGCFLDYDYIKNHYILIAVNLSREKVLDADLKAMQQIEFVGQFKKLDSNGYATGAGNYRCMFVLTTLEKLKKARLKFFQGRVTVF